MPSLGLCLADARSIRHVHTDCIPLAVLQSDRSCGVYGSLVQFELQGVRVADVSSTRLDVSACVKWASYATMPD